MTHKYTNRINITENRLIFRDPPGNPGGGLERRDYRDLEGGRRPETRNRLPDQRERMRSNQSDLVQLVTKLEREMAGVFGSNMFETALGSGRMYGGYEAVDIPEEANPDDPSTMLMRIYNSAIFALDRVHRAGGEEATEMAGHQYETLNRKYKQIWRESMADVRPERSQNFVTSSLQAIDESRAALRRAASDYRDGLSEADNFDELVRQIDHIDGRINFTNDLIRKTGVQIPEYDEKLAAFHTLRAEVINEAAKPLRQRSDTALTKYNIFYDYTLEDAKLVLSRERKLRTMRGQIALNPTDQAYANAMGSVGKPNAALREQMADDQRQALLASKARMLTELVQKREEGLQIVREIAGDAEEALMTHRAERQPVAASEKQRLIAQAKTLRRAEAFFKKHGATGAERPMKLLYGALAAQGEVHTFMTAEEALVDAQPWLDDWERLDELSKEEVGYLATAAPIRHQRLLPFQAKVQKLPDSPHKEDLVARLQDTLLTFVAMEHVHMEDLDMGPYVTGPSEEEERGGLFREKVEIPEIVVPAPALSPDMDPILDPVPEEEVQSFEQETDLRPPRPGLLDETPSAEELLQPNPSGPFKPEDVEAMEDFMDVWPEGYEPEAGSPPPALDNQSIPDDWFTSEDTDVLRRYPAI